MGACRDRSILGFLEMVKATRWIAAVLLITLATTAMGQVISKQNAEHYEWGKCCDAWYLVKNDRLNVIQERMPRGTSETRHLHHKAQQFFYVVKGEATLEVAGKTIILHEYEGQLVPAGVPHQMQNRSKRDLEFVLTSEPPSHDDREEVKQP
jgi:mannose-6-phosphate isomerase-like protein (cupin superfamily)